MSIATESIKSFHNYADLGIRDGIWTRLGKATKVEYTFSNHFHPYVGELIERLNRYSIDGLLDAKYHATLVEEFFYSLYRPESSETVAVKSFPKVIDVSEDGPYAGYNWELLFHVPFSIAVHLSKNQRFAEAQKWFHYIFDPTNDDTSVPTPQRFWKFLRFRQQTDVHQIDELLRLLSKPADQCTPEELRLKDLTLAGYEAIRDNPFRPHVVARTRVLSYQYAVFMKYLDNLIDWGDSLFRQDTIETINEATQLYVLAANLLGPRPQAVPPRGLVRPRTFAQLREAKLDKFSNALVTLEGQFPFNLALPSTTQSDPEAAAPLFGMGKTLYFGVPRNDNLLAYWDRTADRLFKIRHCMNLEGVVRQLPLFEPPLDPGMLVKATAAGIDVSSLVSGLNQPLSPVRGSLLIQKSLEICAEVRAMGTAMLGALEKNDTEQLTLLRQSHEKAIQQRVQDVRFMQWREAQEATNGLLRSRETIFDRYRHYQLLLGRKEQDFAALATVTLDRSEFSEELFDEAYAKLVAAYAGDIKTEPDNPPAVQAVTSPGVQSGKDAAGELALSNQEHQELQVQMVAARQHQDKAIDIDTTFGVLGMLPNLGFDFHFWGLGGHVEFGGPALSSVGRVISGRERGEADKHSYEGGRAARVAGYQRRGSDWTQASNAAAHELMSNGRQIIGSLIREQVTRLEYENTKKQIENIQAVDDFLKAKFTNAELYSWLSSELSKRFYECYSFAFDIARKAEQTMKHELMRPELDDMNFVKFNYWDGGRRGLLSGESLYLDVKRMELAYHDNNKREYELSRHISLAQLDPVALLRLKAAGSCEVTVPEWLFDIDTAGHYLRRIKSVAMSIPAVTGPYTSVHCTLSLLRSSIRKIPLLTDGEYARQGSEDARFMDYSGSIQSIVTSTASNDSGLFETNLRDERYLPFEGAGAVSMWKIELPTAMRPFDFATISDVILHVRYTAREGGGALGGAARTALDERVADAAASGLTRLFSLKYDFPNEWYAFTSGASDFSATLARSHFPYITQGRDINVTKVELYSIKDKKLVPAPAPGVDVANLSTKLKDDGEVQLTLAPDNSVLVRNEAADVFVLLRYTL